MIGTSEAPAIPDEVTRLRQEAALLRNQLAAFKAQVREVAIDVAREQGWCRDGLNQRLNELGLDPVTIRADVTVVVTLNFEVDEIDSEDSAREQAEEQVSDALGYNYNYNIDQIDVDLVED